jgi:DDE superfamily endonuclease
MHTALMPIVYWPDCEQLFRTMCMSFRIHFGTSVAVIKNCFEIFIERPSNLQAQSETWSAYKHGNTAKYLISLTPQGMISFISVGYGGCGSDKFLTKDCGLLKDLQPGDVVLADRGFNLSDSVSVLGARSYLPAFTRGKSKWVLTASSQEEKLSTAVFMWSKLLDRLSRSALFYLYKYRMAS